ncbi:MAG: T9SS type A sorting domain-containing protein [Chitinophagales bacterium]
MNKIQIIRLFSCVSLLFWFTISNAQTNQSKDNSIRKHEKINLFESDFSSNSNLYLIYIPTPSVCELAYEMEIVTPESGCEVGSISRVVIITFSGISTTTEYNMSAQGGAIIVEKGAGVYQVVGNGVWNITASESPNCFETAESSELPYVSNTNMTQETGITHNDGSITVEMTGGTAPYDVEWSNNVQGTISTSGGSHTISGLASGEYQAVITDDEGIVSKVCVNVSRERSGRGRGGKTANTISSNSLTAQPNPFAYNTVISFKFPEDAFTTLKVYNLSGKLIETIHKGKTEADQDYQVEVNADSWASGIYIVQLTADNGFVAHERLLVTK